MARDDMFGTTISLLGKSLDLRVQSHNRISANIANAETPGYVPTVLSFEDELQGALKNKNETSSRTTNEHHIPLKGGRNGLESVHGTILELSDSPSGPDGNGVELESEMGRMVQNQIMYNADIQFLSKSFAKLTLAIKGGN